MTGSPVLDEVLCEDAEVALYRAHTEDGRRVLLKVLKTAHPTSAEYEALRRESEVAKSAGAEVAAEPDGIVSLDGKPALVLRDDGGAPLARLLGEPMPLAVFFPLALELTDAVARVHARHLVHGELHPADILKLREGRIELFGFGRIECFPELTQAPSPIASRPYLSPEQIGRHPHVSDERSDLYSVGVIFFEMLAGVLPFQASDPIGWVHAHCALAPAPLSAHDVPPALAAIVAKLLSKPPESRYQSAAALRDDLARAFEIWKAGREDETFPLGATDCTPTLRVCAQVRGRRAEIQRIRLPDLERAREIVAERRGALVA